MIWTVVLIYAAVASLWILLSDRLLEWLLPDPAQMLLASTFKGWLFVLLTSMLLFVLMRRMLPAASISAGGAGARSYLWPLLLLTLLVAGVAAAAIAYTLQQHQSREGARLLSIAELTKRQIADWLTSGMSLLLLVVFLAAMVDVPLQAFFFKDRLKMSHEEVKQEHKESDGNPHTKGRIRQKQREIADRASVSAVPKADFVVMNPTHYAVALKYDPDKAGAPIVVAKGMNTIAMNIRELARDNNVPILEAPPLARALYAHCELDEMIPAALYTTVAEVMAWVMQLNHWLAEGGLPPEEPTALSVPEGMDPGPGEG